MGYPDQQDVRYMWPYLMPGPSTIGYMEVAVQLLSQICGAMISPLVAGISANSWTNHLDEETMWLLGIQTATPFGCMVAMMVSVTLGDLWKYSGYTWTNIAATGPSPRSQHVAVWDPSNSVIWIHGGINSCVLNDELWKFDTKASTWTAWPSSQQPLARASHVAVWDDANQAIWIHGGYSRTCGDFGVCNAIYGGSTQLLTATTGIWLLLVVQRTSLHVAGWDPTNEAIWIHGGLQGANFCSDLWDLM